MQTSWRIQLQHGIAFWMLKGGWGAFDPKKERKQVEARAAALKLRNECGYQSPYSMDDILTAMKTVDPAAGPGEANQPKHRAHQLRLLNEILRVLAKIRGFGLGDRNDY